MKRMIRTACLLLLLTAAVSAFAQSGTPKPRKFRTTYEIQMYADADFHSKKLNKIPAGVILEALVETERYGGYVQIPYKTKTGWLLKVEPEHKDGKIEGGTGKFIERF